MGSRPVLFASVLCVALLATSGCGSEDDAPAVADAPRVLDLPVYGQGIPCEWPGFAMVLHGSVTDPPWVWLESLDGKERLDVAWPPGYTARFTPALEVRDARDATVTREGDLVDGACRVDGNVANLAPPFLGYRVECGPVELIVCVFRAKWVADQVGWPGRDIAVVELGDNRSYSVTNEGGASTTGIAPVIR